MTYKSVGHAHIYAVNSPNIARMSGSNNAALQMSLKPESLIRVMYDNIQSNVCETMHVCPTFLGGSVHRETFNSSKNTCL